MQEPSTDVCSASSEGKGYITIWQTQKHQESMKWERAKDGLALSFIIFSQERLRSLLVTESS